MAQGFLDQFEHDVFISYAHADDVEDTGKNKWVAQFVDHLGQALRQRIGRGRPPTLYFDAKNLQSNQQLNELLKAARNSAVLLAVASRSYAGREWTRRELDSFAESTTDLRRLFAVECLPLDEGHTYPAPLDAHKRMQFWRVNEPFSTTPMPISPSFEERVYLGLVNDLAEQISNQLKALEKHSPTIVPPLPGAAVADGAPVCLLAQVTDELEEPRDQVRRYLEQFGVTVLPAQTYPQGGDDFAQAFKADIGRANLFVQLLGSASGKRPPDLPQGYTQFQHEAAHKAGVKILQWRRPDVPIDQIADQSHLSLLSSDSVLATGLEAFKAEILRQARPPKPVVHPIDPGLIFINADRKDADVASSIQQELSRHNLASITSSFDGPAEAVRAELEDNLVECNALVFVYGDTTPFWMRGQLKLYNKIKAKRATPPRLLALYIGPPEKQAAIGISLPETREIHCGPTWTMDPLRPLILELRS